MIVEKARMTALVDFGWEVEDILDAIEKLRNRHFYKSDIGIRDANKTIDFYKARKLKSEDVYIHFHVENDDTLVVESFKALEE